METPKNVAKTSVRVWFISPPPQAYIGCCYGNSKGKNRLPLQGYVINGFNSVLAQKFQTNGATLASLLEALGQMEICLHLGAHRTASTSFQVFMNANRKALTRQRVSIWGPGRTRSGLFAGLVRDPNLLQADDEELGARSIGRIKMELARVQNNDMTRLVISEENMIGTMGHNFKRSRLYGQAAARLKRFAPAFSGHKLRIGLAVRSYDSYWASALAFRIKSGSPLPETDQLDLLTTQLRRWRHVISDIADTFPEAELAVWSFEAWSNQPQRQLGALIGGSAPHDLKGGGATNNASLSAAEIGEIARERGQSDIADKLERQIGRYQPFDPDQIHKLRQDYATDIDWLINGSDGLATYYDPTGDTSGGSQDARGRYNDEESRMGQAG